ncbi:hypothetical protein TSMEX_004697 [Taenia solium]
MRQDFAYASGGSRATSPVLEASSRVAVADILLRCQGLSTNGLEKDKWTPELRFTSETQTVNSWDEEEKKKKKEEKEDEGEQEEKKKEEEEGEEEDVEGEEEDMAHVGASPQTDSFILIFSEQYRQLHRTSPSLHTSQQSQQAFLVCKEPNRVRSDQWK